MVYLCLSLVERDLLVQKIQQQQWAGKSLAMSVHVSYVVSLFKYLIYNVKQNYVDMLEYIFRMEPVQCSRVSTKVLSLPH